MAYTAKTDIYQLDQVGEIAESILYNETPLLASGYIANARATAIREGTSDTIKFPKFTSHGDLGVQSNTRTTTPVTSDKVTMSFDEVTMSYKMISFEMEQSALRAYEGLGAGSMNELLGQIVGRKSSLNVQAALLAKGATTSLTFTDEAGKASWNGIVKAKTQNWGERSFNQTPLLIVHSNVMHDIITSDEAKKAGVYGLQGVTVNANTPLFAGCRLLACDEIQQDSDGNYQNLIVIPGALALWGFDLIESDSDRILGTTVYQQDFWFQYAVHLYANAPRGCILYNAPSTLG